MYSYFHQRTSWGILGMCSEMIWWEQVRDKSRYSTQSCGLGSEISGEESRMAEFRTAGQKEVEGRRWKVYELKVLRFGPWREMVKLELGD